MAQTYRLRIFASLVMMAVVIFGYHSATQCQHIQTTKPVGEEYFVSIPDTQFAPTEGGDVLYFEILPYRVPCQGESGRLCLAVHEVPKVTSHSSEKQSGFDEVYRKNARLLYEEIEGLAFEEGNRYRIVVEKIRRFAPGMLVPPDASKFRYKLLAIHSAHSHRERSQNSQEQIPEDILSQKRRMQLSPDEASSDGSPPYSLAVVGTWRMKHMLLPASSTKNVNSSTALHIDNENYGQSLSMTFTETVSEENNFQFFHGKFNCNTITGLYSLIAPDLRSGANNDKVIRRLSWSGKSFPSTHDIPTATITLKAARFSEALCGDFPFAPSEGLSTSFIGTKLNYSTRRRNSSNRRDENILGERNDDARRKVQNKIDEILRKNIAGLTDASVYLSEGKPGARVMCWKFSSSDGVIMIMFAEG